MHHAYSGLAKEKAEPSSLPSMIVQVQIRLQCLDERTTGGERRHGLDLEIELTIDEYPRDSVTWLAAFQAQYDGISAFEKEQWGPIVEQLQRES